MRKLLLLNLLINEQPVSLRKQIRIQKLLMLSLMSCHLIKYKLFLIVRLVKRLGISFKPKMKEYNLLRSLDLGVISNCEIAKEAWDKLQTKNEGTQSVKKSRLRRLTTDFENLTMHDDETISVFYASVCDIANESYALGKV
ncbi:hypothetical protein PanWU01x14_166810 [Parasponia andersonii]|uniref:Uncharacterized protein n=1 Tax=Parasponia andersonii TaxID=3476 RepID=A0A2P5CBN3_PARAD|nr:hypothetical protein PanWU01x14_166810 [Parasponia andersonii]